tara:strand:+ start:1076 stop:1435 length:360 start_codon:yes stop_codon:yes gene_type:complete
MQELSQRLEFLQKQIQVLEHQLSELKEVKESVSAIDANEEVLFPLGAGVYIKGKLVSSDKVVMNVGRGVVVEKKAADALKLVSEQIKGLEQIFTQMNAELQDVSGQLQMAQMEMMQQQS